MILALYYKSSDFRSVVHGAGVDEHLALITGGKNYFYHADGLGSISRITDTAKNIVQSYSYDSFGQIVSSVGGLDQPYTYTGRELNREARLYFLRARYYDPATGRFIGKDPIRQAGGFNFYGYTNNNPINFIDPSGEYTEVIISDSRMLSQGSQFGHAAININGIVFSRAHSRWDVKDASVYIENQEAFRDSVGIVLNTTLEEENEMYQFIAAKILQNQNYDVSTNSCSSNVADALYQIGVNVYGPWQYGGIAPIDVLTNLQKSNRVIGANWYGKK